MAVLGKLDQVVAYKGVSLTIAPLGAVCCVLFSAQAHLQPRFVVNSHFKYS